MNYIDFAIAAAFFLFFFAAVIMFVTNYFSNYSSLVKTSELRPFAESLFNVFFKSKGIPENWMDNSSISPVKIGLAEDLYKVTILLKETSGYNKTNELIGQHIVFDENCENKTWNDTIRIFDEDYKEFAYQLADGSFCSSQYLKEANITWEVNVSANQSKKFMIYYSPDDGVNPPNYTSNLTAIGVWHFDEGSGNITYDETGNNNDGTLYNGTGVSSQEPTWTSACKSAYCLSFDGYNDYVNCSNSSSLNITNKVTIEAWVYLDEMRDHTVVVIPGVVDLKVTPETANPSYDVVEAWVGVNGTRDVSGGTQLQLNHWYYIAMTYDGQYLKTYLNGTVDKTVNIGSVTHYFISSKSAAIGTDSYWSPFLAYFNGTIDEVHIYNRALSSEEINTSFKSNPLEKKNFPEEKTDVISYNKFEVMNNLSYDELKKTIGDFKISLNIDNETYGDFVNQSANTVCYQSPTLIQYKNGTVKKIMPNLCVWK